MRIIFLDFDGVLNTEAWQRHCIERGIPTEDGFGPAFDPESVAHLEEIVDAFPDTAVVITSSWKLDGIARMQRLWEKRSLPGKLLGITPDYVPKFDERTFDDILQGILPVERGAEIKEWQKRNNATDCPYVILDDLQDFYPDQQAHFVEIDPRMGITAEDASRAIEILRHHFTHKAT
ncbi:MAG: hypothetical protein II537_02450 [Bacteroidales bacterium]|nr:hypothetical protein [Bacteroidales bacterium]